MSLWTSSVRRSLVPLMRFVEVANDFRPTGQHVAEQRLALRRTRYGCFSGPVLCYWKARPGRSFNREKAISLAAVGGIDLDGPALDVQHAEQHLGFDVPVCRSSL